MTQAFAAVGRALRVWWREPFTFILLNIVWLIMQIPLITGPAATATLYNSAYRAVQGDYLTPRQTLEEFRRLFLPALIWGVLNLIIVGAVVFNLAAYREASGLLWSVLRGLWASIGASWLAINVFYWPFWLEQERPTIRTTLFNCVVLIGKRPLYALTLVATTAVVVAGSILLTLPLAAVMMSWVALIGTVAVDEELAKLRPARHEAEVPAEISTEANG